MVLGLMARQGDEGLQVRCSLLQLLSQMVAKAGVNELLACWSQEQEELREIFLSF